MDYPKLLEIAKQSAKKAYCPHTNFGVGAALLTKNGKLYSGFNVENAGILSICAERVTFSKAFTEGEDPTDKSNFIAIMIIGYNKKTKEFVKVTPCGYCRQFMSEFVNEDFKIIVNDNEKFEEYTIKELLPHSYEF